MSKRVFAGIGTALSGMGQDVLDRQAKANERAWEMKKEESRRAFELSVQKMANDQANLRHAQGIAAQSAMAESERAFQGRQAIDERTFRSGESEAARKWDAEQARLNREHETNLAKATAEARKAADSIKAEAARLKTVAEIELKIDERTNDYRETLVGKFGGTVTPQIEQQVAEFESELRASLAPVMNKMMNPGSASEGIVQPRDPWESTHMPGRGVGSRFNSSAPAPANPASAAPPRRTGKWNSDTGRIDWY